MQDTFSVFSFIPLNNLRNRGQRVTVNTIYESSNDQETEFFSITSRLLEVYVNLFISIQSLSNLLYF